jgi:toxin-antitoxin system PIN domain toxin
MFLLDVNVVIALIDPAHIHHDIAHRWFGAEASENFATCPLVQNGVLRIAGHPAYPNAQGAPAIVAGILTKLLQHPGHVFWPDDVSLLDRTRFDQAALLSHKQVTDTYLLGLAVAHAGRLATLDAKLSARAVSDVHNALHVIH